MKTFNELGTLLLHNNLPHIVILLLRYPHLLEGALRAVRSRGWEGGREEKKMRGGESRATQGHSLDIHDIVVLSYS
jgi:hypothetical protein